MIDCLYTTLTVIACLAILNSYAIAQLTIPIIRYLERRNASSLIYFLECDQCRGFWLTVAVAPIYGSLGLFLVSYGMLIIYLRLTTESD